jgi:hypothetical protein
VDTQEVLTGVLFAVAAIWIALRMWKSIRPSGKTGCNGCSNEGHKTKNPAEAGF